MAFQNRDISVLAYASGFTIWHYKTQDPYEKIEEPSYFNDINDLIHTGDIIYILTNGLCYQRQFVKMKDKSISLIKIK